MNSHLAILGKFAGVVFCAGMALYCVFVSAPEAWKDLTLDEGSLKPATEFDVTKASCKTAYIATSCDFDFKHRDSRQVVRRDVMIFGYLGDGNVFALTTEDGYVTSNISIKTALNRLIFSTFGGLLFLGAGLRSLWRLSALGSPPLK